jgi:hypothetical protein
MTRIDCCRHATSVITAINFVQVSSSRSDRGLPKLPSPRSRSSLLTSSFRFFAECAEAPVARNREVLAGAEPDNRRIDAAAITG